MSNSRPTILVTGAGGGVGSHLVRALEQNNFQTRALTSRPPPPSNSSVEWRQMDWRTSLDFDSHVEGCSAVVHLAVEKHDIDLMPRINVAATDALATAAARAGIKLFCYASSISVYGSPRVRLVDEQTPVVTPEHDVASEYWAEPYMRAYARSKVASERLLQQRNDGVSYIVLRPTIVRSGDDIRHLGNWSFARKLILAGRLAHTIAMEDVVHSILWFLKDTRGEGKISPGFEAYNVSDDHADDTYANFFRTAYQLTRDPRYRCPPHAPAISDRLMNWAKFRTLDPRWPLGLVTYSSEKLFRTGYTHVLGAAAAYRNAVQT